MAERMIEARCLKGLKFNSATGACTVKDGRSAMAYTPVERDLSPGDVLSFQESPEGITFVTADGIKYFWNRKTRISARV